MRSLRVGVLLRGTLVEERLFDGPVTVGQSLKCDLSVPADELPREHLLFAHDDRGWTVLAIPGMAVKIADGQGTRIAQGSRGRLVLGDTTILFQEMATPAAAPRPKLPPEVRGTRLDRRLVTIVAASLAVHLGIGIYAWFDDVDSTPLGAPAVATAYAPAVDFEEQPLPALPTATEPTTTPTAPIAPAEPGVAAPIAPHHDIVQRTTPQPHIANQLPDEATLREQAIHMADLLVAPGQGTHGTPGDMSSRTPNVDLAHQIDASKHVQVSIGNPTHDRDPGVDVAARKGTALALHQPGEVTEQAPRTETKLPTVRLSPVRTTGETTTLTADAVLDKINGLYLSGLQRCYQKGLARDASLLGRVNLALTVDETGRVSDRTASGSADEVDSCIEGLMANWHFGVPHDRQGKPTEASFAVTLALAK